MKQRRQARGWHGYFDGFRVNCESVPRLPAWVVRWALTDPRGVPYLLLWRWRYEEEIKEALRVSPQSEPMTGVELKRADSTSQIIGTVRRSLPRNGGNALFLICPCCCVPRRYLYGWRVFSHRVIRSSWICRTCAGLRYRSEGAYLSPIARIYGGYPRTPPWEPDVFSNLKDMISQASGRVSFSVATHPSGPSPKGSPRLDANSGS